MAERRGLKRARMSSSKPNQELAREARRTSRTGTKRPLRLSDSPEAEISYVLVVGLDFGTTFSGAAWYIKELGTSGRVSLQSLENIRDWTCDPSSFDKRCDFPTEIHYDPKLFATICKCEHIIRKFRAIVGFENYKVTENAVDEGHHAKTAPLRLVKLLLSDDADTESIRTLLRRDIQVLINEGVIDEEDDVFIHIFLYMLQQVWSAVQKEDSFSQIRQVEFAIGIPPSWSALSRRRELAALERAIEQSNFRAQFECSKDIFAITETEAATECRVHETRQLDPNDAGAFMDGGGGTTDVNVYRVQLGGEHDGLRLDKELIGATGIPCGASSINKELHDFVERLLQDKTYLFKDGKTLQSIIHSNVVRVFELKFKRTIDFANESTSARSFFIQDLRPDTSDRRFTAHYLKLSRDDMQKIYDPYLKRVTGLVRQVLDKCWHAGPRRVKLTKFVLVGGASECIPLIRAIQEVLDHSAPAVQLLHNVDKNHPVSGFASNAVALGCVLRALDKEGGPRRILDTSVGLIRHEPYDSRSALHKLLKLEESALLLEESPRWIRKGLDQKLYVFDTVEILIPKDTLVDPVPEPFEFDSLFEFTDDVNENWECTETIVASDNNKHSGYPIQHPANRGVDTIGTVTYSIQHLLDDARQGRGPLTRVPATADKVEHYEILLKLRIHINGLRLTAELGLPDDAEGPANSDMSITSVFKPGTI